MKFTALAHLLRRYTPGNYRRLAGRGLMLLSLASAIALQWWTWNVRYPLIAHKQGQIQAFNNLINEVQTLRLKWSDAEGAQVEANLKQAYTHVFEATNLFAWLQQFDAPTNIPATITWAEPRERPHPQYTNELVMVSTLWEVKPVAGRSKAPLMGDVLSFLEDLVTSDPRRMDFVALTVNGDGTALTSVQAGMEYWVRRPTE
jgi:hypothetical protein